ncbi:unnamed protein product [Symbiodinium sp. KB8]|nr:unnamed protein product [Symbiodinium sp. KB8]
MLPPVPNFNDASVREDILAELAQQETLLQQLQIMEELYADELELGKLLSRLELDDKPEVLPPSKTAICLDNVDTLPMSWDDPTSAGWVPPVEPLLEDAAKLEADSWKELGLHPYDEEGSDVKPTLQRALHIDAEPIAAVAACPEAVVSAEAEQAGHVPEPPSPVAFADVRADGAEAERVSEPPSPTVADEADEAVGGEAEGSVPESPRSVADDADDGEAERKPSEPRSPIADDAAADGGEAESATLEPPVCLRDLKPISPTEQNKLLRPDADPEATGRCEPAKEADSESEGEKRPSESENDGETSAVSKKAVARCDESEHEASEPQPKRRKCIKEDAAADEDGSFEAGFRIMGRPALSPASKKVRIEKAGGRIPKKSAKAEGDRSKKPTKVEAGGDPKKKSTKAGGDPKKKSTKAGGDPDKKSETKVGGDPDKKSNKAEGGRSKKSTKAGGDPDKKSAKAGKKKPTKASGDPDKKSTDGMAHGAGRTAETKARLSRKSVAYHKARSLAKANGATDEEAKEAYRETEWIIGTKVAKMDGAHCESIVVNLIQAGAPKIFIGILLLIIWSENLPAPTPRYSFFDLFAGKAQASSTWKKAGYSVATFDKAFEKRIRVFDFLSPAGMESCLLDAASWLPDTEEIPDSWLKAITAFDKELTEQVSVPETDRVVYNQLVEMDASRDRIASLQNQLGKFHKQSAVPPAAITGAPSIAAAGGVFVAGNAVTTPDETLMQTQVDQPTQRALSFDSAWRVDELESPAQPLADAGPKKSQPPPESTEKPGALPEKSDHTPKKSKPSPKKSKPSPKKSKLSPKKSKHSPKKSEHSLKKSEHSPKKSEHSPKKSEHSPKKSEHSPKKSEHSPKKSSTREPIADGSPEKDAAHFSPMTSGPSTPGSTLSRGTSSNTLGSRSSRKTKSDKFDKYYFQMRRFCKPSNGPTKASKEALQLWGTGEGRQKLRQLLIEKGSFKEVEVHLAKYKNRVQKDGKSGRWVTKAFLMEKCGYTKQMADNSFNWAAARKLVRTNEVHKCDEAKLVLEESFAVENESGERMELSGAATLEDVDNALLDEMNEPPEVPGTADVAEATKLAEANASGNKVVFPTLAKNDSPVTILPTFLSVLGKKIELATTQQEKLATSTVGRATLILGCMSIRMAEQMQKILKNMNDSYAALSEVEAEILVDTEGKNLVANKQRLLNLFVKCTKDDVTLNNYKTRARNIKASPVGPKGTEKAKPKAPTSKAAKKEKKSKHNKKDKKDASPKANAKKEKKSKNGECVVDAELQSIGRLATGKDYHNASRNLHKFLHSSGKTLPIPISTTRLTIRRQKKGGGEFSTNYPLIYLSSWMRSILQWGGEFLLGGWSTHQPVEYRAMFARFWERYEAVNQEHPIFFEKTREQQKHCIPIACHGDEGRGLGKNPVLVESYQPVIPWSGEDNLNMVGRLSQIETHSFCMCYTKAIAQALDPKCSSATEA